MSAYGYKQTFRGQLANVRFTPESGHSEAQSIQRIFSCPHADPPSLACGLWRASKIRSQRGRARLKGVLICRSQRMEEV